MLYRLGHLEFYRQDRDSVLITPSGDDRVNYTRDSDGQSFNSSKGDGTSHSGLTAG